MAVCIERFNEVAALRGGRCLNPEAYVNAKTKLTWQCLEGHTWQAWWGNIKLGHWCPQCQLKSEGLVRAFLEFVTDVSLPSAKPAWLRNCGGPKAYYQLDGLNDDTKLAFEYHGPQHYKDVGAFHRDGATLLIQQERDAFVRDLCAKRGVRLIEVPTLPSARIDEQLAHIRRHSEAVLGPIADELVAEFAAKPFGARMLDKLHAKAEEHGGLCLSTMFTGVRTRYDWQCAHGHRWQDTWSHIQDGRWCLACSKKAAPTKEKLCAAATSRGGLCLNPEAYSRKKKLTWRCAKGHEWQATWTSIQQGRWCSTCAWEAMSKDFTLSPDVLRKHAESKGGVCLNPERYDGNTRKLQWRCAKGHEWKAAWASVQQAHWCPRCARIEKANQQRDKVYRLMLTAADRGGRLVRQADYKNAATPVTWECGVGHVWQARWGDIKRGRWCPECNKVS